MLQHFWTCTNSIKLSLLFSYLLSVPCFQRIFIQNFYYFNKFVIREQCYENLQSILTNFFNVLNAQDKRMVKCLEMLSVVQKVQGLKPIKFTSQKQAGISL